MMLTYLLTVLTAASISPTWIRHWTEVYY